MSAKVEVLQDESRLWHWRCWDCGWVGFNCGSEGFAIMESSAHVCRQAAGRVPLPQTETETT